MKDTASFGRDLGTASRRLVLEIGLLDLATRLADAEAPMAALLDAPSDGPLIERVLADLRAIAGSAETHTQLRVAAVGHCAAAALESGALSPASDGPALAALLQRAHELMTVLVHDAIRQLDGHAAAALEGAVDAFIDHASTMAWRWTARGQPVH
ncbi:MAG: hypothetical protein AB7K63_03400 [Vicinamibacterales bacterium]